MQKAHNFSTHWNIGESAADKITEQNSPYWNHGCTNSMEQSNYQREHFIEIVACSLARRNWPFFHLNKHLLSPWQRKHQNYSLCFVQSSKVKLSVCSTHTHTSRRSDSRLNKIRFHPTELSLCSVQLFCQNVCWLRGWNGYLSPSGCSSPSMFLMKTVEWPHWSSILKYPFIHPHLLWVPVCLFVFARWLYLFVPDRRRSPKATSNLWDRLLARWDSNHRHCRRRRLRCLACRRVLSCSRCFVFTKFVVPSLVSTCCVAW